MRPIPKSEFARLVPVSSSQLLSWLREYREDLQKLGANVRDNTLNYLCVLYLCDKQVVDTREIYPDATQEEIKEAYSKISNLLQNEKVV